MKLYLIKSFLLPFLLLLNSCTYDNLLDDINQIKQELSEQKRIIEALQNKLSIVSFEVNDTGCIINFSDGQSISLSNGITPIITIGENGNWFINGVDTGSPSKGDDGIDGNTPIITIGKNGNWFIDGVDTGSPSKGDNGIDGNSIINILYLNHKIVFYFTDGSVIECPIISNINLLNDVEWIDGIYNASTNQQYGGSYQKEHYKFSSPIDITNYENIYITGCADMSSNSTADNIVGSWVLLDENFKTIKLYEKIKSNFSFGQIKNGDGKFLYLKDYKNFNKIYIVVTVSKDSDNSEPLVEPDRNKVIKRIVGCGDSLMGHSNSLIIRQLNSILKANGYDPIISRCKGGENIVGNLTRAGGLGIMAKSDFIIPESGSVNIYIQSAWMNNKGEFYDCPYSNIVPGSVDVVINGVRGSLNKIFSESSSIAFYDNNKHFISSLSVSGNYKIPNDAVYIRCSVNDPCSEIPNLAIDNVLMDILPEMKINGYINTNGDYVESNDYKCTDYIDVSNKRNLYFENLIEKEYYQFIRYLPGNKVKIGRSSIFWDAALYDDQDYVHIWFTGQNGGYYDEKEWADMVLSAANNFSNNYIVCSTALDRTTDALVKYATMAFGAKYINLRAYTQFQAVYDGQQMGLIDDSFVQSDYETLFWPGSDKIHQNELLSYIWAVKMWNTMLELGFVEGNRIETGDYYVY